MSALVTSFVNVPNVVKVRCHYCSQERPAFTTHQLTNAQRICDHCLEWHNKALELLAGTALPGCQECGKTWEQLRDEHVGEEIRMYAVPKDGIYQVLCAMHVQKYLPKRADLYGGTKFGRETLKI